MQAEHDVTSLWAELARSYQRKAASDIATTCSSSWTFPAVLSLMQSKTESREKRKKQQNWMRKTSNRKAVIGEIQPHVLHNFQHYVQTSRRGGYQDHSLWHSLSGQLQGPGDKREMTHRGARVCPFLFTCPLGTSGKERRQEGIRKGTQSPLAVFTT